MTASFDFPLSILLEADRIRIVLRDIRQEGATILPVLARADLDHPV